MGCCTWITRSFTRFSFLFVGGLTIWETLEADMILLRELTRFWRFLFFIQLVRKLKIRDSQVEMFLIIFHNFTYLRGHLLKRAVFVEVFNSLWCPQCGLTDANVTVTLWNGDGTWVHIAERWKYPQNLHTKLWGREYSIFSHFHV